ncbi:MmgE/PrpD family protein [Methanobacterium sp. ACI-7]|uniref:MmgE/PrpD family protein n=1 Tax=unclassified Methanobacterium TaxID=2627676 RepID=UPI0039C02316
MITKIFADYITSINYDELPEKVIEQAKLCFLDFLGVTLRGSKTKSACFINKVIKKDDESTVIGFGKSTILDSALANGIAAHSLDLDDGNRMAQLHPGVCVIPAVLSVCEAYSKNGKEFISAIVAGYEIAIAMGILVNPEHRNKGFHSTGTCGTFGAAAAACSALNLDEEQTINALGLAGTHASGLLESDHAGSMGKHLHAGKAAQSGVLSALLAIEGFTGASTIIEGKEGFLSATSDLNNARKEVNVGEHHILNVYFKKYPVCRHLHSTIDAALNIISQNDLKIEDIKSILVKTYKIAANHDRYNPKTLEGIRQSLPFALAVALKNKDVTIDNLQIDECIAEISSKVVIECSENFDNLYPNKRASEVIIKTDAGSYSNKVDLPKGEPENQFTKEELVDKFYKLNPYINTHILHIIDNLEDYNIRELMLILNNEFTRVK